MKNKLLVLTLLSTVAIGASAQSSFEGAYGQVGIGYESLSPSFSGGTITPGTNSPAGTSYSASSSNINSFAGNLGIGYNFAVTNTFLLGVGVDYSPIKSSKQTVTVNVSGYEPGSSKYGNQNTYNIFLTPGFVIDKDKLAYAKVGYSGSQLKADGESSTNFSGYLLGLGYKQIISGGLYGFGEVNYTSYGEKNFAADATGTVKFNTTNILVGLGYKF